ncbi:Major Facilitator Superfamily Vesicular Transporter [Pleurotus pulmonarius]
MLDISSWGAKWRSSYWFVTGVVGLGIITDLLVYSIVIPVMPFHLESLGYANVSSLTGWLLFAYSGGLVVSTIPTAMLSERYNSRKAPLLWGLLFLIGSQIMLMEAPNYPVMVVARILQGLSSSMVWVVGLALLCDCTPKEVIGRQLGIAMTGLSIGVILGPPLGGLLYDHFGFRGPFVFGIAIAFVDLVGRLLIIETKLGLLESTTPPPPAPTTGPVIPISDTIVFPGTLHTSDQTGSSSIPMTLRPSSRADQPTDVDSESQEKPQLSLWQVLVQLAKSPRALSALFVTLTNGLVYATIEPALPLRLQDVWHLDSTRVGVVFIAGLAPSLLSSPIAGYLSDKMGPEWVLPFALLLAIPWWLLLIIRKELGMFIAFFVFASFSVSAVISPVTAELATVSRHIKGVGFAHVYGAFNVAFGVGSALGPIVGGQLYDHVKKYGWTIICVFIAGILVASLPLVLWWSGDIPLWRRLRNQLAYPGPRPQSSSIPQVAN